MRVFCGLFRHHIGCWVKTLQSGGTVPNFPDTDTRVWEYPNCDNKVKIGLKRVKRSFEEDRSVSFQTLRDLCTESDVFEQ
jgi:hypothetical protein